MYRRVRFFFRERYWWIVALGGLAAGLIGQLLSPAHSFWGPALVGISSSMIAAMLVSLAGPDGQETYQKFLQMGVKDFYANRNMVPGEAWVDWLESAQRSCILLGVAHGEWLRDDRFEPALINRLIEGVQVQIFFLDPTSAAADVREKEDQQRRDTKSRIKDSIRALWLIRSRLTDARTMGRLTIYTYDATPSLGVTWIDDWMLVTHYLAGFNNLTSPALRVESNSKPRSPFAVYSRNVLRIREISTEVTDGNVDKYVND